MYNKYYFITKIILRIFQCNKNLYKNVVNNK